MGNKRSRDTTRPKDRGRTCQCDQFDFQAVRVGETLTLSLVTDLREKVRVAVKAYRVFRATDGSDWEWTMMDEKVPVGKFESGTNGFVLNRTIQELDAEGVKHYRYLARRMEVQISDQPGEIVTIQLTCPTTPHQFGVCNRNLTGGAVIIEKRGHRLEAASSIAVPILESLGH